MSLAYVFSILSQAVDNFMLSMENTHDIFCFKGDKNNFNWYKIQIIFFPDIIFSIPVYSSIFLKSPITILFATKAEKAKTIKDNKEFNLF